jgi:hypothetical protein
MPVNFPAPTIAADRLHRSMSHPAARRTQPSTNSNPSVSGAEGTIGRPPWMLGDDWLVDEPVVEAPISINQFFPFVLAPASAKRDELRSIKQTIGMYTQAVDYWRLFRLQVAAYHGYRAGPGPDALDAAVELAHPDRRHHYEAAVEQYRQLIAGASIEWIGAPRRAMWLSEGLQVRVNPELHLNLDGEPHVVKLYLKAHPRWALNQRSANGLAYLLDQTHGHLGRPLVFDVLRGRAFRYRASRVDEELALQEQAATFVALWRAETVGPSAAEEGTGESA